MSTSIIERVQSDNPGFASMEGDIVMSQYHRPRIFHDVDESRRTDETAQQMLRILDLLGRPFAVFGARCMVVHRNTALVELLATEPGRDEIMRAARDLAATAHERTKNVRRSMDWSAAGEVKLCPHRRTYALGAVVIPAGVFAPVRCVVVLLGRTTPHHRRSDDEAMSVFNLTRRQMQVARLLLAHYSAPEIANALTISTHTARHHVEQVYRKANVSGRHGLRHKIAELRDADGAQESPVECVNGR